MLMFNFNNDEYEIWIRLKIMNELNDDISFTDVKFKDIQDHVISDRFSKLTAFQLNCLLGEYLMENHFHQIDRENEAICERINQLDGNHTWQY